MNKEISGDFQYYKAQNKMELLPNYYLWIFNLVKNYYGKRIADIGCGRGFMLNIISQNIDYEYLLGIDGDPNNIENNILKSGHNSNCFLFHKNIESYSCEVLKQYKIDTILFLDVLEHIKNDINMLKNFYNILPDEGSLIIKVPALKCLYGPIDIASEHYRRYSKKELTEKAKQAGFNVLTLKYMNIFGMFLYIAKNKIFRQSTNFSRTLKNTSLKEIDKLIPFLEKLDKLNFLPIGLSLIGVFRKQP